MKRTRLWISALAALAVSFAGCASDAELKERARGHLRIGTAHIQAGQYAPALKELMEAEKLTPDDPAVHYNMGIAYERRGFTDEAVREFQKAIALKADYAEAHNYLGTIWLSRGLYDESIASFTRALANPLYETPSVPLYNMGRAYVAKGDLRGAYASFNEAIRKEPNTHLLPILELNLGVIDYRQGTYLQAERHLQKSVERAPNLAEAHYWLGMTQMQLRKRKEAAESFRKVIQLAPDSEWGAKSRENLSRL
ncbi:MAG TPA: tetratricopeptide repeat protein [Syntrophales bacterium]|nr:tetratricopeptide repeat protein [Syntrophales bacterium]